jgi:hypothetical protein
MLSPDTISSSSQRCSGNHRKVCKLWQGTRLADFVDLWMNTEERGLVPESFNTAVVKTKLYGFSKGQDLHRKQKALSIIRWTGTFDNARTQVRCSVDRASFRHVLRIAEVWIGTVLDFK